jgi:putative ABC transport system permease protein
MEIRPILSALLRSKTGAILIAAQVALTLAIVSNALYVVNDRLSLAARPSGVDEDHVFEIAYQAFREIDDQVAMQQRDIETLRAIPGVVAVASANQFPMGDNGWGFALSADPNNANTRFGVAAYMSADPLVDAFRLALIEGRDFEESDYREIDPETSPWKADSVIITRRAGERAFPGETTYAGKIVYLNGDTASPMTVVGVVDELMTPFAQNGPNAYSSMILPIRMITSFASYAVRTEPGQRARVMADAEKALSALRNDRVLVRNRSMNAIREEQYRNQLAVAGMLIAVTVFQLLVTGGGIVGLASLWVNQRRKQIGTRRALGATRGNILRYFLTENVLITSAGIAVGVALAIGLNLFLVKQIALERLPPEYIGFGMLALWVLGIVAVLGPAYRAAAVPPAVATRSA